MKDVTINSSLHHFTLSNLTDRRLFFVSGKGGVGKTTLAAALTHKLNHDGHEAYFVPFKQDAPWFLTSLKTPHKVFLANTSLSIYLENKMKSKLIASWIQNSSFFSALFKLLPSLEDMILLGHIISHLKNNPQVKLIVDAPSTGHLLSLINATTTWKNIFKTGALIRDIEEMDDFMANDAHLFIVTIPQLFSISESNELYEQTQKHLSASMILNNFLDLDHYQDEIPDFLLKKIDIEKQACANITRDHYKVPKVFKDREEDIIEKVAHIFSQGHQQ